MILQDGAIAFAKKQDGAVVAQSSQAEGLFGMQESISTGAGENNN